jgi:two-component system OmpR family response regulator
MRILVIEDDRALSRQLSDSFVRSGYSVDVAHDGEAGEFMGATETYDAAVLDLGLPKINGLKVLKSWRDAHSRMPVLILTARGTWSEKVQGLEAGADDYVTKPFHIEEVLARIRALIRRAAGHAEAQLEAGPLRLDPRTGEVTLDGAKVELTSQEFRVLSYMMHHAGEVVSRSELIDHIYGCNDDPDSNTIEVFVSRLRRKLGAEWIETLKGLGYRFAGRAEAA